MNKRFVSYEEYGSLLDLLCKKIKKHKRLHLKYVSAVPRGGYPIAIHLSHHLDLEFIDLYKLDSNNENKVLLVDDIADTGETLNMCCPWDSFITTATLFFKNRSEFTPDFYLQEVPVFQWIVFPWEKNDEKPNREL